jgi:hypothetical protein
MEIGLIPGILTVKKCQAVVAYTTKCIHSDFIIVFLLQLSGLGEADHGFSDVIGFKIFL